MGYEPATEINWIELNGDLSNVGATGHAKRSQSD